MQFRLIPAILVFLGSYFPLAIILAVQDVSNESWELGICTRFTECTLPSLNNPTFSFIALAITLVCFSLTLIILYQMRYKYPVKVLRTKRIPNELIGYSFPYIVSFMGVDYGETGKLVGFLIFMAWLFFITYRAGQIILNPMLSIIGWNLYEAEVSINGNARTIRLLSKTLPTPGTYHCQVVQGNYINRGEKIE